VARRRRCAGPSDLTEEPTPRVWHVFATYLAAVAGIFAVSGFAILALISAYPDVPEEALLRSLPGLLAGSIASSTALMLTIALVVRPLEPARLRLLPGWETSRALAVMVVGMLTLGQALDSLTALAGFGDRGSMAVIRRALETARGPDLFGAVVVIGVLAGAAEEIFFRGYMQTRLRAYWPAPLAVTVTTLCFAILHFDPSIVHILLAGALSLYLGFVAEVSDSALPAIVCHVVNNVVFTLQTAFGAAVLDRTTNVALAVTCAVAFVACVMWLRRAAPPPPAVVP
jgi:membrane protease YdiL (CAAX protease family)